jgi:hypothetical protein
MKLAILLSVLLGLNLGSLGQKINCKSLHSGTFKAIEKGKDTTIIKRTKSSQIEENAYLGYKLAYDITWTSDCSYELRLKEVLKGAPSMINVRKNVLKIQIKQIKKNSYITETSSTYSNEITTHEIFIEK